RCRRGEDLDVRRDHPVTVRESVARSLVRVDRLLPDSRRRYDRHAELRPNVSAVLRSAVQPELRSGERVLQADSARSRHGRLRIDRSRERQPGHAGDRGYDLQVNWSAALADLGFTSIRGTVSWTILANYLDYDRIQAVAD